MIEQCDMAAAAAAAAAAAYTCMCKQGMCAAQQWVDMWHEIKWTTKEKRLQTVKGEEDPNRSYRVRRILFHVFSLSLSLSARVGFLSMTYATAMTHLIGTGEKYEYGLEYWISIPASSFNPQGNAMSYSTIGAGSKQESLMMQNCSSFIPQFDVASSKKSRMK